MKYSIKHYVHNYDCDLTGRLSLSSMIKYFEDIALLQSEDIGYGMEYYFKENVAWILHKWNIQIFDRPFFRDNVTLVTNPYSYKAFYANREFEIYSEEGELLIRADSVWIFLDTKNRKPKKIDPNVLRGYGVGDDGIEKFDKLSDIEIVKDFDFSENYTIRKSDIDINNHLNNVRYIDLAIEMLPDEITEARELGSVEVIFKKEMLLHENMTIGYKQNDTGYSAVFNHTILNSNNEVCAAVKTEWD